MKNREIIVDNFAGGGGASTGIEMAIGRSVDIAINHDPAAIAMHKVNHPTTKHYCESVWDVDPVEACQGRLVALAWFSPDCKHFSKAKGGKPVEKKIRGLAWIVLKWAAKVRPRVIMLENVEEFQTWGPIRKGRPIKSKSGQTFQAWKNQLESLGYKIEHRELKACDYGTPTIRKRFFLVARCDGKPIEWPEPTHGNPNSLEVQMGLLKPWRTAAEIIDWSLPCPSIFDRKKPLAENTLKRIARGLQKFVIDNPKPFIVQVNHSGSNHHYCNSIECPLPTITSKHGFGVVTPYLAVNTTGHTGGEVDEPIHTITTGGHHALIAPTLIQTGYGEREGQAPRVPGINKPLGTVVSTCKHAVVAPTLIQYHTETTDQPRGQVVNKPISTIDASPRYGLVSAFISKYYAGNYKGFGSALDEPVHTVTSKDHNAVITTFITQMNKSSIGQTVNEPLNTVTAGANHFGEVRAFLIKYYGQGTGQSLSEPLDTVVSKDRFGLITINNIDYQIVDIGLRMLEPYELFAAQGFPDKYIIDHDYTGKPYPKTAQVARCGNAVPPPFAEALTRANLPEYCIAKAG
ncbi:DNA (cytosine-5)-methyltransferase 1 [Ruminiclostridium sufflavum DSM 19573]|uniref:DNA (cytosine-5-)-methyltransferase n=1 Tax=Ruminiclostridium sufflavum DSM 19573 TaxID=1121337 RepID=A0A318Y8B3_9FIRM|nr:DNA cytosine methyltransferase [Ruminiclostridium sufflavum]PYG88474.1 DNA (cytosine-5)-methyltransferase 1 [Ruminiclostridium sufflavum DSM 19573]